VPEEGASDPLTDRVADVVDAGLQLGASIARTMARATGSADAEPTGKPPIDDVVSFGTAMANNLIGLVTSGVRAGVDATSKVTAPVRSPRSAEQEPAGATPMVRAGATLRVPLLVENTGPTPTRELAFATTSLVRSGCDDGDACVCLPSDVINFTPPTLVVAARDFEKLTVRVAVPPDTPIGRYTADIAAGEGWFSTQLAFSVIEAG
jgi:hypothetical protein